MLDDFFIRALIAGIGIALVAGPLGCFVIWRRLSFLVILYLIQHYLA